MWDQANKRFSWLTKGIGSKQRNAANLQKSGLIPPALVEEAKVPKFYRETIVQCGADTLTKLPNMNLVYSLMQRSGLSEGVLQAIWESVAPSNKDQLTRQEFYSCLVLIALAQRNLTIAELSSLSALPLPNLSVAKPTDKPFRLFKNDENLKKPHGHLLKTVHPLFTDENVKINDDLICLNSKINENVDSCELDLYPSSSESKSLGQDELNQLYTRLTPIWERLINAASEIFSIVQQTNSNVIPAFITQKGHIFITSLHQVEGVVRRIHQAARTYSTVSSDFVSRCEILLSIWTNLVEVLEWSELLEQEEIFDKTEHLCNLCGIRTNVNNTHFDKDTELSYHISCANFWLNTVEGALPRP